MASSPSANIRPWLIYNGKQKMEKITLTPPPPGPLGQSPLIEFQCLSSLQHPSLVALRYLLAHIQEQGTHSHPVQFIHCSDSTNKEGSLIPHLDQSRM